MLSSVDRVFPCPLRGIPAAIGRCGVWIFKWLSQLEPIQKILITLYNHFKKLYITKLAKNQNRNLLEVLNLKQNQTQTFLTTKYKTQSEYFKTQELKEILQQLIDLDRKSKSGLIDINIGLEAIIANF